MALRLAMCSHGRVQKEGQMKHINRILTLWPSIALFCLGCGFQADSSESQDNQSHAPTEHTSEVGQPIELRSSCIKNRLTRLYLSDKSIYWNVCKAGEKWSSLNAGNGMVCLRNDLRFENERHSYLSDKKVFDPTLDGYYLFNKTCEAGEYWRISDQGDGSFCILNKLNGKFLSDRDSDSGPFWDICGEGERFITQ